MWGTLINVAGILIGGIAGLAMKRPLSPANQAMLKITMGALTVFFGLQLTWRNLGGTFVHVLKQLLIVVLALTLGKLLGKLCRFQKFSNSAGQYARRKMEEAATKTKGRPADGFVICSILFCVAPLALLGSVQEGLANYFQPLVIKALVDGLSMMAFVMMFGAASLFSFVPVLAYQGLLTLGARALEPWLTAHALVQPINATGGLLVFCVALIILDLKKIEAADYLPSLLVAPVLAWWIGY